MDNVRRVVDIDAYMAVAGELLERGESICLTVTGSSMAPFLVHGRDSVSLERPRGPAKRGDILLFRRESGRYVLHRVIKTEPDGSVYLVGDGRNEIEGPVAPEQAVAVAVRACRKGRWIERGDFWWDFFAGAWLRLLPFRGALRGLARFVPRRWR